MSQLDGTLWALKWILMENQIRMSSTQIACSKSTGTTGRSEPVDLDQQYQGSS